MRYYVTEYEETSRYCPEEGGYYSHGLQDLQSMWFDSKEEAQKYLQAMPRTESGYVTEKTMVPMYPTKIRYYVEPYIGLHTYNPPSWSDGEFGVSDSISFGVTRIYSKRDLKNKTHGCCLSLDMENDRTHKAFGVRNYPEVRIHEDGYICIIENTSYKDDEGNTQIVECDVKQIEQGTVLYEIINEIFDEHGIYLSEDDIDFEGITTIEQVIDFLKERRF